MSAIFLDIVQSGGTPVPAAPPSPTRAYSRAHAASASFSLPGDASRLFPETGKTQAAFSSTTGTTTAAWPSRAILSPNCWEKYPTWTASLTQCNTSSGQSSNTTQRTGAPLTRYCSPSLARSATGKSTRDGAPDQAANTSAGSVLFPQTGKRVGGVFLDYWNNNGALAQQGYPISDEFDEVSDLDGKTYRVQYFERAVFELHSENAGTPYEVLLSQLGTFRYRSQYPQPGAPAR